MKINLFLTFSLIALMSRVYKSSASANNDDAVANNTGNCNINLLTSHGLHGLITPQPIIIEMCPNVHQSCCSKRDQL